MDTCFASPTFRIGSAASFCFIRQRQAVADLDDAPLKRRRYFRRFRIGRFVSVPLHGYQPDSGGYGKRDKLP